MAWPTPQDYNEAIQNPAQNLADPELAAGHPELTALGLPRPITGNFASVYRLHCAQRDWAVRCFWRDYADMSERYAAISRHLQRTPLPYTTGFEYLPRGIRVHGTWYPILKMEWVEGDVLGTAIERLRQDPAALQRLAREWLTMVSALERAGVAHGDLQHGNVLVAGETLRLVDYDGMYVPALAGRQGHEIGHQHYQHPGRTGSDFGPHMDRFAAWSIYLSLRATALEPALWDSLQAGDEHLLLGKDDYLQPQASASLRALESLPDPRLRGLVAEFRIALTSAPSAVPALSDDAPAATPARRQFRRGSRTRPPETAPPGISTAPAWLADHIAGPSFAPLPRPARVTMQLLPPLGVVSAVLLVLLGAFTDTVFSVTLFLADAALVLAAYMRDTAVRGRRVLLRRERAARRRLRRIERTREQIGRRHERALAGLDRERDRLEKRRGRIEERERAERSVLTAHHEEARGRIDAEIAELTRGEAQEVEEALEALRAEHSRATLRALPLSEAGLPSLSPTWRVRLWLRGMRNAGDVTQERLRAAADLPPDLRAALAAWRVQAELQVRRTAPHVLPVSTLERFANSYGRERARLEDRKRLDAMRERADLAALHSRYAERYVPLDAARNGIAARSQSITKEVLEQLAAIDKQREEAAAVVARLQRDLDPSSGLTLPRYAIWVLRPTLPLSTTREGDARKRA